MDQGALQKLGELLRQQREQKNLSLKEVENATSIRISYLKAIEDGDVVKVISPAYAQGFFKQYACFLGLDGDHLIKEHQAFFGTVEKQDFAYGIGTLEQRCHPGATMRWVPSLIYALITAGCLVLAWYFARYMGVV
jgi:cytoskeletal protein RodZ